MKIAILGTGVQGTALARLFVGGSHSVVLASRDPEKAARLACSLGAGAEAAPIGEAVRRAEVVALATRWENTRDVLAQAGAFEGRVLIDATNPETEDGRSLAVGHSTSGAETIARWAPDARVVKAFNHAYAELLDRGPVFPRAVASVLYCGDDPEAKSAVARLIGDCGFDPVDAGPLTGARFVEPLAFLFVELVRGLKRDPAGVALSILSREREG
ncbi:MAG: NADPH-dependent F420 reductase [Acidobacteriota bacterium]|nr:NADPH-dependent F420 reductase [Acidobacteriota bacterium]